eukprot:TRINITY_DN5017_c0_g1_i2.p1 TRINITY_DN5017_c0_g1~~TRINITY_DN5017_c0_g1_i2.p1  ORF type:complete len:375 (-),score=35.43 TRINITY_DN5017_c0_g1_i2:159-1229(-)
MELGIDESSNIFTFYTSLINNSALSDVVFIIGEEKKEVYCHKIVLATRSKVFLDLLYNNNSPNETTFQYNYPEFRKVICDTTTSESDFLSLMCYVYAGRTTITSYNKLALLRLSTTYDLPSLRDSCVEFILKNLAEDSVLRMFVEIQSFNEPLIVEKCMLIIRQNTKQSLSNVVFHQLPLNLLLTILNDDFLTIQEIELFKFAVDWLKVNKVTDNSVIEEVFNHIRFPLIPSKLLLSVVKPEKLVSPDMYVEALEYNVEPGRFDSRLKRFQSRSYDPNKVTPPNYPLNNRTITSPTSTTITTISNSTHNSPCIPPRSHSSFVSVGNSSSATSIHSPSAPPRIIELSQENTSFEKNE